MHCPYQSQADLYVEGALGSQSSPSQWSLVAECVKYLKRTVKVHGNKY